MTELKLENARIISQTGDTIDGVYEITLRCRLTDVEGVIVEPFNLSVKIENETK